MLLIIEMGHLSEHDLLLKINPTSQVKQASPDAHVRQSSLQGKQSAVSTSVYRPSGHFYTQFPLPKLSTWKKALESEHSVQFVGDPEH